MVTTSRADVVAAALKVALPKKYNSRLIAGREMDELHLLLEPDELPIKATSGTAVLRDRGQSVLAVGTDRRILVFDRGHGRSTVIEFQYQDVRSIDYRTGWIAHGEVAIVPKNGAPLVIKNIPKAFVREFGDWLTSRVMNR